MNGANMKINYSFVGHLNNKRSNMWFRLLGLITYKIIIVINILDSEPCRATST